MQNPLLLRSARRVRACLLSAAIIVLSLPRLLCAQDLPPKNDTHSTQVPAKPAPANDSSEVSTRDTPPTFRVRVNLVLLRAVVRDAAGKVVTNLKKEDFQLSDNRK